jgi:hypothetical protein
MLASYAIARIIQEFPAIDLPADEGNGDTGIGKTEPNSRPVECRGLQSGGRLKPKWVVWWRHLHVSRSESGFTGPNVTGAVAEYHIEG